MSALHSLTMMYDNIFNIPISCDFVDEVAQRFLQDYAENPLELTDVLFLLPNRRACQSLKEAFVRAQGLTPTLLPQMMPIADVEEDELWVKGFDFSQALAQIKPSPDAYYRLFWFVKRILKDAPKFGLERFSADQACALAVELCSLIDETAYQELSFDNLKNLVPEEYAAHWLQTLSFLDVITREWPEFLQQNNLVDGVKRRIQMLEIQMNLWLKQKVCKKIVVLGTTAAFPVMRRLVKTVLNLPNGMVILSGVDKFLDDESFKLIDETHPQFEFKQLFEFLDISRFSVKDFCLARNEEREKLVSEIMRPAKSTHLWRDIGAKHISAHAWDDLKVLSCADIRAEALSIALMMRHTLEAPEKTAALVTTDRDLARRVAAELNRWDVKVDDSAGKPLHLTPVGIFLRLIIEACQVEQKPVDVLSLMKHPLFANGNDYGGVRRKVRDFEKLVLRADEPSDDIKIQAVYVELQNVLAPLKALMSSFADFKTLLITHIQIAEKLATTAQKNGTDVLWRGDDGESAAMLISAVCDYADMLEKIHGEEYLGLFEALMRQITVRPKFGTHPRLKILGPIEARLSHFDLMIVGELNEGAWPKIPNSDPWMSRPMKKSFGLSLPEKDIGVEALDFCHLLGAKEVVLTRAERVEGTPMVHSRWWLRLQTVMKALQHDIAEIEDKSYLERAQILEKPDGFFPIKPPEPRPRLCFRPRKLSASAIENLMRDPYIIFAKYILKLYPLNDLDKKLEFVDYGNIVHKVLQEFNNLYPQKLPDNALDILLNLGEKCFAETGVAFDTRAFWWPNFVKCMTWVLEKEKNYRQDIFRVHNEISGKLTFQSKGGDFTLTAKADRVDETNDGKLNILDYKTGQARTIAEMEKGFAPQLPIEGLIAQFGGFDGLDKKEVAKLIYWQLAKKEVVLDKNVQDVLDNTFEKVHTLIAAFDDEATPYYCQPNPAKAPKYSDYLNLARVAEWKVVDNDED